MIRPLEPGDGPAVHALFSEPAVARRTGGTPFEPAGLVARRVAAATWRFGWFEGDRLRAVALLTPGNRPRTRGTASLVLAAVEPPGPLLDAVLDAADRWLALVRVETELLAGDPLIPLLEPRGFAWELDRRHAIFRDGALADLAVFGRIRPGFSCPPPTSPPPWPARAAPGGEVRLRASDPADAEVFRDLHHEPTVLWGTLQDPTRTAAEWRTRLAGNDAPGRLGIVAEVDGEVAGSAGIFVREPPFAHVGDVGMALRAAWQGRGIGARLLDACLEQGLDWLGLQRLELEVWPDNTRAHALYRGRGFEEEGRRRLACFRDGTFVDCLVMSRVRNRS